MFLLFFRNAHRFGNSSVLFSLVLPLGIFLSLCCLSFCVPPTMSPAFGVHAIMFAHSLVAFLCSMSCSQRRASTKIAQSWYSNYLFWSLSKHACVDNLNMFVSLLKPPRCIAIFSFRIHPGVLQNAPTNIYAKITRGFWDGYDLKKGNDMAFDYLIGSAKGFKTGNKYWRYYFQNSQNNTPRHGPPMSLPQHLTTRTRPLTWPDQKGSSIRQWLRQFVNKFVNSSMSSSIRQ